MKTYLFVLSSCASFAFSISSVGCIVVDSTSGTNSGGGGSSTTSTSATGGSTAGSGGGGQGGTAGSGGSQGGAGGVGGQGGGVGGQGGGVGGAGGGMGGQGGAGGGMNCVGCGEYVTVEGTTLCDGLSTELYDKLYVCICMGNCANLCADSACIGDPGTSACLDCVVDTASGCGVEFNECANDI